MDNYSLPEAQKILGINLSTIRQYIQGGELSLYAPDKLGKPKYELHRYETVKFFNSPNVKQSLGCNLHIGSYCPRDCKFLESMRLSNEIKNFPEKNILKGCGPSQEELIHWKNAGELNASYCLEELIIKREDLEKFKSLSSEDSIESILKRRNQGASDQTQLDLKLVNKLRESGKKEYEIIKYFKQHTRLKNWQIHDLLNPDNEKNRDNRKKSNWVSDEAKKDPNRPPPKKRIKGR